MICGLAGVGFVKYLNDNRSAWDKWKKLYRDTKSEFIKTAKGHEMGVRLAEYIAAIYTAAVIVHEALDLPWRLEEVWGLFNDIWAEILDQATDPVGEEEAAQGIYSWALAREDSFFGRHDIVRVGSINSPLLGKWDATDDWDSIGFTRGAFNSAMRDLEIKNPNEILHQWRERGWLVLKPKEKAFTHPVKINGSSIRLYVIRRDAFGID